MWLVVVYCRAVGKQDIPFLNVLPLVASRLLVAYNAGVALSATRMRHALPEEIAFYFH